MRFPARIETCMAAGLCAAAIGAEQHPQKTDRILSTDEPVRVEGGTECKERTEAALEALRRRDPAAYMKVEHYLAEITCTEANSGIDSGSLEPDFAAERSHWQRDREWYAGVIVHDACHVELYDTYAREHPGKPVPKEVHGDAPGEKKCLQTQASTLRRLGAAEDVITYIERDAIKTRYWENP